MRRSQGAAIFCAIIGSGCGGNEHPNITADPPDASPTSSDAGWRALTDWDGISVFGDDGYRQFSSYDRGTTTFPTIDPGNKDFNNFLSACGSSPQVLFEEDDSTAPCDPGFQGHLVASAEDGPGFISRIYFAVGTLGADLNPGTVSTDLAGERIRIYVDDLDTPAYEGALADWKTGASSPFVAPLAEWTSGALVSYVPISYQSKVRVLLDDLRTERSLYYYQVDLQSTEKTSAFRPSELAPLVPNVVTELRARAAEGAAMWTDASQDVPAGQTVQLLDRNGPGTVRLIRLTLNNVTDTTLDDLRLVLTWDNQGTPAVNLPLASIFGCRPAASSYDTLPMTVVVNGTDVELSWSLPMPFSAHASAALTNTGTAAHSARVRVDGISAVPAAAWGYLHAGWQEKVAPIAPSTEYPVADLTTRGKYVGTMMALTGVADQTAQYASPMNFLEGDETGTVDGKVAIHGTGTEEFVNGGWYFKEGRFDSPFSTLVSASMSSADPKTGVGQATMFRWHVLSDAISFKSAFELFFEYGANEPGTVKDYSSVAFYYAR